ncbi:MAG: Ig-like domain-containing protein, partial [Burkholderiaceae bacterium]|nr:Ig-like domain-containing protein [Burkholderiaceae bacterium]
GNGTLSTPTTSDNGVTWTATFTPSASVDAASNVISLNNTGVTDAVGNTGTGTTSSGNFAIATTRPTASIGVSDAALTVGETATVTIAFFEPISGLTLEDFTVDNGTLSNLVVIGEGLTYTATLTPTSNIEDTSNSVVLNNTGITDSDGNTGAGTTSSDNYAIDTKAPTATITLSDDTLGLGETSTVTITFHESVVDFSNDDITVNGGTLGTLTTSDSITWTATLTPLTTGSGSGSITLASGSLVDIVFNSGPTTATSTSFSYAVPPTITIASIALSADTGTSGDFITNTASQTISGTLSAALSGSEFVEVSLDGGSNWTSVSSVSGTSWSLSGQTLSGDNTLMARVSNSSASGTALSHAYQLDQSAPSATITLSEAALLTGETAIVTITFSEAVSGLTLADLKSSGTLTNLASNSDGTVWTATLSATSGGEVRLDPSSVIDIAGNSGPATSIYANYTYNAAPTATIASVSMTDPYNSGDFITSSASQVISGTLSAALGRGQFVEVSLDNGATWSQATISNGTNWSLSGQTISASNTLKVRASNGTTTGTEYSHSYTLDQTDPTLSSVTLSSSALLTNQTATVTVVFDEAVYDLTKDDFVVSGGTLGTFTTTDQLTWTGTLTPTASGNIVLSPANVTDRAGNVGNAANSKIAVFTFTADTTGPSATLTLSDNTLAKGGTATLTVTLSEAVADTPVASDFTVAGGTLGTFSSADNGLTWTATLTPTNGAYGEGYVLLKSNTINDPAGNPGPSSSASLPFIYDTQTLTLSSTMALSSDSGSSASDFITNTGTQTISGAFSGGSIYANMGGKIEVSTDNGSTWNNATVDNGTHTWSISASLSGSNTIQVRLTDGTGIAGTAVTQTYTIDSTAPEYLSSGLLDLSTSSDTGNGLSGSTTDNVTTDTTPTVTYSLYNTGMLAGDYVDIIDISTNTTLASHLITSSDLASYGNTITTELGPLSSGNHYLQLRGRDVAGNVGTLGEGRLPLTIDTSTASMENKTVTLHTDSDSGSSHRDNITNDNTPTVTVNVANTANLSAGDELQIIDSSNADAVVGTYRLTSSDFNSEGEDISITTSSLADGNHALKLRVYDKAGNYGTAGIATTITIDTIAPTLTSSTPSSSSGSNSINTSAITLGFSEALAEVNSRTGFKISNGAGDVREITGELTSGDMLSYDAGTHTFTLSLSGSLQYDSSYDVTVYNQVLTDAAGNSREIDTLLLTFSTESSSTPDPDPIPPSGVTLSLSDTTYASYVGTEDDHITSNNILTVSGITATFLQYKLSSDDFTWTTVMPSSGTYELTLGDGTYGTSELQFRQFNDTGYESDITTLNNAWTIDTQGPILWIERADEFLGQGNASQIALSVGWSGEINPDDTIIEYSTDGTTWTKASSTTSLRAQLTGVNIAAGGELQVRATDKAGNAGTHNNATYIAYFGDSTAATHTAAGGKYLFLQGADDIVDISGNSNVVYTSYGANTVHINASSNNTVVGGNGIDTITLTGASSNNHLFPYEGNDIITLGANVTSTFIGTGDGNDTIAISSTNNINTLDGGAGVDTLQFNAAGSLAALVGQVTNIEKLYVAATSQLTIGNTVSQANLTAMGFGTVTVQLTQYALVRLEGDSGALLASGSHYAFSDSSSALVQALGSELTSGHNIYVNTDANIILLVGTNVSLGSS